MANGIHDIMQSFRFLVEIDGMYVGGFTHVSGLDVEVVRETYREGGLNGFEHQFASGIKYSPIVLKRGIVNSSVLLNWCQSVIKGNIQRMHGAIVLLDAKGEESCRWTFFDAYPIRWTGPDLDAMNREVAFESITLAHNGIKASLKNK